MTHPLANPKSSDHDALVDLGNHRGFQLLIARLKEELATGQERILDATGPQEVGRFQGAIRLLGHVITLREELVQEIEEELNPLKVQTEAERRAYEAFFGNIGFFGTPTTKQ